MKPTRYLCPRCRPLLAIFRHVYSTVDTDSKPQNRQRIAQQSVSLLRKLLPVFNSQAYTPTEQNILDKLTRNFVKYDKAQWSELEPVWPDLLSVLGRLENGKKQQLQLIECRKRMLDGQDLSRESLEVISKSSEINSISDLDQWFRKMKSISEQIDQEFVNEIVFRALKNLDIVKVKKVFGIVCAQTDFKVDLFASYVVRSIDGKADVVSRPSYYDSILRFMNLFLESKAEDIGLPFFELYCAISGIDTFAQAMDLSEKMNSFGLSPDEKCFRSMIKNMDVVNAKRLIQKAVADNIYTKGLVFQSSLSFILKSKDESAYEMYQFSSDKSYFYTQPETDLVIDELFRHVCYSLSRSQILYFVEELKANKYQPNLSLLSAVIAQLSQVRMAETAKVVFMELRLPLEEADIYEDLLVLTRGFLNSAQIAEAIDFVHHMESKGFRIGKRVRLYILKALLKTSQLDRAYAWFIAAADYHDIEMANALMRGFSEAGKDDKVKEIFGQLPSWNLKPNDQTFGIIIGGLLYSGRAKEAFKLLQEIKKQNKLQSGVVYAAFLKYFTSITDWKTVDRLYDEICKKPIDDTCASLMIRAFGIRNELKSIVNLAERLTPQSHPEACRDLVIFYLRAGYPLLAQEWFEKMQRYGTSGQFAYSVVAFIGYHARNNDYEQAERYLSMYLNLFPPHSRAFNVLVRSVSLNGLPLSKALAYWEQMKRLKVPLDTEAYNSIIAVHADFAKFRQAEQLYQEFLGTGQVTTVPLYCTLIAMYGKQGMISKMESLYHKITNESPVPLNAYSASALLNALMTGYSSGCQWQKVLVIWRLLRSSVSNKVAEIGHQDYSTNAFHILTSEIGSKLFGVNSVTICVVLDSLGYAQRTQELELIWTEIIDSKIPLTLNNWISYMEALLRCNLHNQGINVVLNLPEPFQPDRKMLTNCLALLPPERRSDVFDLFKQKYETIPIEMPTREPSHLKLKPIVPQDKGLSSSQLSLNMKLRKGVLILPGEHFKVQIPNEQ